MHSFFLIDTKSEKVCFAEAGNDVVEFLIGLLSLPLGTVVNLLTKDRMGGSLGNVLSSAEKLDAKYKIKERRLSPAVGRATLSCLQQLLSAQLNNATTLAPDPVGTTTATSLPTSTYTIGDNLSVTPASFFTTISLLGITELGTLDLSALQQKTVKIGKEEALEILVASLKSETVPTDVFLPKKKARR
ncbi:uncharacterized protein LOC119271916 [Triticum dicoccoides]|uniref:uncharacterized protein LOC119271916 n=1 Tax=Triticum dicoccoides TaxID=85692 RepID=UPI00188FA14D|nr:uncharacterized protein LOC119271916 [Triticum dicoccoides]